MPKAPTTSDDRRMLIEERAAIMEFDGGMPRADAELKARLDVAQQERNQ